MRSLRHRQKRDRLIDGITSGKVKSFDDIATKEKKVDVTFVCFPLAFVPRHRSCIHHRRNRSLQSHGQPHSGEIVRALLGSDNNTCSS